MSLRPIRYADVLEAPNAAELLAAYAAECSIPQIGTPQPQAQMYAALENAGVLRVFGAYSGYTLVGFASVLTSILPHYGKKVATLESLFVHPDYRDDAEGFGLRLMSTVEDYARSQGCGSILYSAPSGGQLERLLTVSPNYQLTNSVFCRSLA